MQFHTIKLRALSVRHYISVLGLLFCPFPRAHKGLLSEGFYSHVCYLHTIFIVSLLNRYTLHMCVQSVCSIDDLKNTHSVSLSSQLTILVPAILSCNAILKMQSMSHAPEHYMCCYHNAVVCSAAQLLSQVL